MYIDKIISWALADPLSATFNLYYQKTKDERALAMSNFIKYGTNDIRLIKKESFDTKYHNYRYTIALIEKE